MKEVILQIFGMVAFMAILSLGGCAYSYVDQNGNQHITGLVDLTIKEAQDDATYAGAVVSWRSFGVSITNNVVGSGLVVGYFKEELGYLKDSALLIGDPLEFEIE